MEQVLWHFMYLIRDAEMVALSGNPVIDPNPFGAKYENEETAKVSGTQRKKPT